MTTTTSPLLHGTYAADPVHSSFGFAVRYQGVSLFKGTLDGVAATLADGRLEGTAQVESISIRTPDQFRQHVLSAEFFDAANHPEVTFTSNDLDLREDGTAKVAGELTIKGITRPVELEVEVGGFGPDPYGGTRAGFSATGEIDRTEFGMNPELKLPTGGVMIGEKIQLTIEAEATLKT